MRSGFNTLSLVQRLEVALGPARGMAYLASIGMVHRDLAARNVLLDSGCVQQKAPLRIEAL